MKPLSEVIIGTKQLQINLQQRGKAVMDCYILGYVVPLNGIIYLRKNYKILGLNINERKNREFVTKRNKVCASGLYFFTFSQLQTPDNHRKAAEQQAFAK